jgi:hypothetical protein
MGEKVILSGGDLGGEEVDGAAFDKKGEVLLDRDGVRYRYRRHETEPHAVFVEVVKK